MGVGGKDGEEGAVEPGNRVTAYPQNTQAMKVMEKEVMKNKMTKKKKKMTTKV